MTIFVIRLCLIEHSSGQGSYTLEFSPERGRTMVLTLPPFFPHRRKADGSFDSICLKCLLTIASARTEADLKRHEENHICNPSFLFQQAFDRAHENGRKCA